MRVDDDPHVLRERRVGGDERAEVVVGVGRRQAAEEGRLQVGSRRGSRPRSRRPAGRVISWASAALERVIASGVPSSSPAATRAAWSAKAWSSLCEFQTRPKSRISPPVPSTNSSRTTERASTPPRVSSTQRRSSARGQTGDRIRRGMVLSLTSESTVSIWIVLVVGSRGVSTLSSLVALDHQRAPDPVGRRQLHALRRLRVDDVRGHVVVDGLAELRARRDRPGVLQAASARPASRTVAWIFIGGCTRVGRRCRPRSGGRAGRRSWRDRSRRARRRPCPGGTARRRSAPGTGRQA